MTDYSIRYIPDKTCVECIDCFRVKDGRYHCENLSAAAYPFVRYFVNESTIACRYFNEKEEV